MMVVRHDVSFFLDESVEDVTIDGRKVKKTYTRMENSLLEQQEGKTVNTTIVWAFNTEKLELCMNVNQVTSETCLAKSVFQRI